MKTILLWPFTALLFSGPLFAFDEFPVGARPAALGEAFTAVADDVHSLYYNPAGLASLYRSEVTAYYARPFPGLSDQSKTAQTFVGAALPLPADGRWGGFGVGYHEFRVDSLFKERTITLAYGRPFLSDRLALGVGLKVGSHLRSKCRYLKWVFGQRPRRPDVCGGSGV
ncbi:MAG: hypothetical protein IPN90_07665 [Elusimicrobia bacterium]|nr:hypothetical protein [Elusimicrobiota bacterium]